MNESYEPKRVLRVLNRFNIGGPTYNATYLTKYLSPEYETILIAGNKLESESSSEFILEKYKIKYKIIKSMNRSLNLFKDIMSLIEIIKIIKDFKPDIVHTHASKSGAIGRIAGIMCGVPIIVHTFHGHVFHSYFGKVKTMFYIFLERLLAKKSSAIISISKLQKQELINDFKICSPNKMHVINLGFDLKRFADDGSKRRQFRSEFNLSDEVVAVGIIGRITLIKDHKFFVDVINNIKSKTRKELKFFIIGDGEEKENIKNYIIEKGLSYSENNENICKEKLIHFASWRQDMENVYAGLDIVSLTSKNEGTPVTLIEAQACSKPVISTNVGGVSDIMKHNITGYISEVNNLEDYSANLIKLIENKNKRVLMGNEGYAFSNANFSYKRLVSNMNELYKSLEKH